MHKVSKRRPDENEGENMSRRSPYTARAKAWCFNGGTIELNGSTAMVITSLFLTLPVEARKELLGELEGKVKKDD